MTHQALDEVYADQRPVLVRMLARLVGSVATAEDLAQEAYLRVASLGPDRPVDSPRAFLFRTARNLAIDHVRRGKTQRRIFAESADAEAVDSVPSPLPSPETTAADRQRIAALDRALANVPARARQVLILSRLHGLSFPEIGARLDVSVTTVQKDLRLAMAHCLAALVGNEHE